MKLDEKSLRIGAAVLLAAVLLRLIVPFLPGDLNAASVLFFLESGRWIEIIEPEATSQTTDLQAPVDPPGDVAVFSPQQAESIAWNNPAGFAMDAQGLLLRKLEWNLQDTSPRVLIIHTHTTESFKNDAAVNYRSLNPANNMLAVGDRLAAQLEEAGIGVIHDRTIYDHPAYDGAYTRSRQAMEAYLEEYPDIYLILDLHRDAYQDSNGNQVGFTTSYEGQKVARIMLVVSAFDGNIQDPQWHENMALALKLQAQLQTVCQGITRPIQVRSTNYNQALGPRTLLLEMGAAGNYQQEVFGATDILAQSIIALAQGAKPATLA